MTDRIAITKLLLELVRMQVVTERTAQDLEHAFNNAEQERFDDFLLEEGVVEKDDLLKALSQVYQVPYMDAEGYFFQMHMLHMFPKDLLMRYAMIPMEHEDDELIMVASDPTDPELLVRIGEHVSYDVQFCVGLYRDIIDAIEEYYDPALTQVSEDDMLELRAEDLDTLALEEEERDQSALLKENVDAFVRDELAPHEMHERNKKSD